MMTLIEIQILKSCARICVYGHVNPLMGTTSFKNQHSILNLMHFSSFDMLYIFAPAQNNFFTMPKYDI